MYLRLAVLQKHLTEHYHQTFAHDGFVLCVAGTWVLLWSDIILI